MTYHVYWKELICLALCDPADAVTPAMNVQVSCEEPTSFSEQCGLTSLHTLIWKGSICILSQSRDVVRLTLFLFVIIDNVREGIDEALRSERIIPN